MKIIRSIASLSWLPLLLLLSLPAQAEQAARFGDIEVHYNAFNSTFLDPKVADHYGLQRSKNHAILNISVLNAAKKGKPGIKAMVKGSMTNILGQEQTLDFKEFTEGDAVYYLASFTITNDESLNFDISVQADPNKSAEHVKFQQHFYVQ